MKQKLHLIGVTATIVLVVLLGGCAQPTTSPATPPATAPTVAPVTPSSAAPTATPTMLPAPQEHVASEEAAFTYASPDSQEIPPEAVQALVEIVSGYVQDDKVVGAELMVLKNRRIVLHEAFGWQDRDKELAMPINTLQHPLHDQAGGGHGHPDAH